MLDFSVKLKPKQKPGEEIIKNLFVKRIQHNKPCIIFLAGDSGEGKSWTSLRIAELIEPDFDLQKQVIYSPYEYPDKLKWILYDKEANRKGKKKRVLIFQEARELVKSKLWYSLMNQSISDVNAMSRAVKPLIFIIISQHIGDVDRDIRKTINFYGWMVRTTEPMPNLYLYKVWKSLNLEAPKLMHRRLKGVISTKNTKKHIFISKFKIGRPKKETIKEFEKLDFTAKSNIILRKLNVLNRALDKEKPGNMRIEEISDLAIKEPEILKLVMRKFKTGNRIIIKKHFKELFHITHAEGKEIAINIREKLKKKGRI